MRVLHNESGNPMNRQLVGRALTRSLKCIGVDREIRVHDLRHTATSIMIQQEAGPKAVQEILGHANISITMDLYVHTDQKMLKRAVELGDLTYVAVK